ncbi:hypothetical protein [Nonomuraea rubra]|uniref:DNA-binding ferritin-like protein (Dps family) n=1 Tax=Nonomuraea rubra TaxID=46180 RepID=A0A7X0NXT8_9ACTN|nr:hypothetical protein [Nonomuraea rubra]MBB6551600.1 DNA-binding ferritin-like protein (Dps family) [Nonomuraea rubra]
MGSNEPRSRLQQALELVTGSLEDKKRWRTYKARVKALPENYRRRERERFTSAITRAAQHDRTQQ